MTQARVFESGRPIGTGGASDISWQVDQMVVSVGPYMLSRRPFRSERNLVASDPGSNSPPTNRNARWDNARREGSWPISADANDGVHWKCVTRWLSSTVAKSVGLMFAARTRTR